MHDVKNYISITMFECTLLQDVGFIYLTCSFVSKAYGKRVVFCLMWSLGLLLTSCTMWALIGAFALKCDPQPINLHFVFAFSRLGAGVSSYLLFRSNDNGSIYCRLKFWKRLFIFYVLNGLFFMNFQSNFKSSCGYEIGFKGCSQIKD